MGLVLCQENKFLQAIKSQHLLSWTTSGIDCCKWGTQEADSGTKIRVQGVIKGCSWEQHLWEKEVGDKNWGDGKAQL